MPTKRPDTPLAASPDANFEYTKKYADSKKKIEKNPVPAGIKVSATGTSSAKPYEKKFIPADSKRTRAMIVDGKGSKVKESKGVTRKSNDQLYREYKRDSTDTMDRRNRNANFRNISTGKKDNLSAADLKTLKSLDKIKKK
jgi:hypothetical protein